MGCMISGEYGVACDYSMLYKYGRVLKKEKGKEHLYLGKLILQVDISRME